MWGWALCIFRELIKEVKECKKGCTTICVSAKVLDQLLGLYFLHSTHPTQKAAVQREDDLRQGKENERNRFNGPDYLILRRSPVRIVDKAGPSCRTEPIPDTTDPLSTQEPAVLPTSGTQTSQPDKRPHLHPRDRVKEIATSQLKKQKTTTKTPTRTPQRNLNFEEVTTDTSVPPASASTARDTQTQLQVRNQLTEEHATTYQLRHETERHHHDVVTRAKQLEEFEAELQKKLPMEKELQTLRATHQSLRDKVVELEGSVIDLQATNAKWAASYT